MDTVPHIETNFVDSSFVNFIKVYWCYNVIIFNFIEKKMTNVIVYI